MNHNEILMIKGVCQIEWFKTYSLSVAAPALKQDHISNTIFVGVKTSCCFWVGPKLFAFSKSGMLTHQGCNQKCNGCALFIVASQLSLRGDLKEVAIGIIFLKASTATH